MLVDYPNLSDTSNAGFLADSAAYAAKRRKSMDDEPAQMRTVVLTTYSNIVGPSFVAAGYDAIHIDMPAGPDHTAAFVLLPTSRSMGSRTLYIEAVNEEDEKNQVLLRTQMDER